MERAKQISNEELLELTKKAFEQNEVVDFLQGINGYACPVNRFVPANVPTDFGRIIDQGIYLLYKETKDETICVKAKNAIQELLEGTPIQVWVAYSILWSQLYNELHKISAFQLSDKDLLIQVKQALIKNKDELHICKEWQGWNREHGLWDDIYRISNILKKKYGVSIL